MLPRSIFTIIVEDSPTEAELLERLLLDHGQVIILGKARGIEDGLKIIRHFNPELVFLDIELEDGNAFELLKLINEKEFRPAIIFTTGFNDYAIQAIRYAALDYLLKPIDPEELKNAINRFLDSKGNHPSKEQWQLLTDRMDPNHRIKINTNCGFNLIHLDDIIYLEADGNYTDIHLIDNRIISSCLNLGRIEALLNSGFFFRIHRSVTINMKYLSSVNRQKRRCFLKFNDMKFEFCIPTLKIRELEKKV